jgi:hypothetical protein
MDVAELERLEWKGRNRQMKEAAFETVCLVILGYLAFLAFFGLILGTYYLVTFIGGLLT